MSFEDFPSLLSARASELGAQPAITFYRGRTLAGRLTYPQLASEVARAAGELERLGVRRGDRVAVLSTNRLEAPVWLLALWRTGAIAVPLNPGATPGDWRYVLDHEGACGCIGERRLLDGVSGERLAFVRAIDRMGPPPASASAPLPPPPLVGTLADEPAVILYTSGTTGDPKGVTLSQRALLANAAAMAERFRLARTTQLAVLPLYHAHALGFGLNSALVSGGHLVLADKLDPFAWTEIVHNESVVYSSVVPSLLPLLAQARVQSARVPSLRALLVSSAPLATDVAREFEQKTRIPLVQGWGLSEFTNFACCLSPHLDPVERERLLYERELPSIGAPLAGVEVAIHDGELWVRGASRMIGYYKNDAETRAALAGDWLRTGDQGFYHEWRGQLVYYINGRIKEIIIRGGEKHSPLAVEKRLCAELPELHGRLAVVGFAHAVFGEEIGAYLELDALDDTWRRRLFEAVERLPLELRPKVILHAPRPIPRTHTGKVQRRKLQPLFAQYKDCRGPLRLVALNG
jgi:acyl-CoA synthetase (AMP-forming)/AMP-acid ligase II